ncbi:unnamed protein product [Adineta ricciae]|uniref:Uncharacterized protein n=1 Tax=Adineta ricciae TaxID=249248 RepID=A0A814QG56_ADIRI|nr:unnamed protein product [Adineta ricciae]CAF1126770.1 unnamed protein product [Adineta ricciae]
MLIVLFVASLITGVNCQSLVSYGDRNLQCYSCSDCPEPFFYVPTQVTITPPDVGQCMKTVVTVAGSNRLLVKHLQFEIVNDVHNG